MGLTTDWGVSLSGEYTKASDLSAPADLMGLRRAMSLSSGTGAGKADLRFADTRTLSASATEDLDLAGSLADIFGATLTFVKIKGLYVKAADANTNNVVLGNATSNAWAALLGATHTLTLRPGASIQLMTGQADATAYAVTAGTGDLLKVANSGAGTSVTYDIVIVGTSV